MLTCQHVWLHFAQIFKLFHTAFICIEILRTKYCFFTICVHRHIIVLIIILTRVEVMQYARYYLNLIGKTTS